MKYIRTKDGRICDLDKSISNIKIWCSEHCYSAYLTRKEIERFKNMAMLCKQADTIKELCDVFVIKRGNGTYCNILMINLDQAKYWSKDDNNAIIYGAIWTDKGLIYVAKMNENGELELL